MAGCSVCLCEGQVPPKTFIIAFVVSHPWVPAKPDGQAQYIPGQLPPSHISGNAQVLNVRSCIPDPLESLEKCPWLSQGWDFSLTGAL